MEESKQKMNIIYLIINNYNNSNISNILMKKITFI